MVIVIDHETSPFSHRVQYYQMDTRSSLLVPEVSETYAGNYRRRHGNCCTVPSGQMVQERMIWAAICANAE